MDKVSYLTQKGLDSLKKEINTLVSVDRPNISKQIGEARDKGDLSENAEYDAAKEAQGLLELKISKLQAILRSARVIDESKITTSSIQILNQVKLKNLKNNMVVSYKLVAESEADLKAGKISIDTPIAKGLLGKKVGDIAEIQVPSGTLKLEVLEISI